VKVGLYLDVRNPERWQRPWRDVYAQALELCIEGERLGADSVWLSEHHFFDDGYISQPLTFAAAVAARTSRVRIGTAIYIAGLRPAAHILEEAAIVDQLSGGRLDLGLGAGYRAPEFERYGADPRRALPVLFERAQEVRRLLAERSITPPPAQDPFPLWLGCNGPMGARRTGRLGERLLSVQPGVLDAYLHGLEEGGHEPREARMSGPVNVFLADDPERAWPEVARYYAYLYDSYRAAAVEGTRAPPPQPGDMDQWRRRGLAAGLRGIVVATPEEAAVELRAQLAEMPVDTIFMWSWLPGIPQSLADRHVELVCTELRPLLAAA
jgi:alkanesulfonate monooxygenase SsuD/methylene tetrahydromethanopterin reductase-like flavin-dependent oxidoreductase (luciferase family)